VDEYFGTVSGEDDWVPRYNIAPSQPVVTIRQDAGEPVRKLSIMQMRAGAVLGEETGHRIQANQRSGRNGRHDSVVPGAVQNRNVAWFQRMAYTSSSETARQSNRIASS
jgi:hypothetical protein